MPRSYPTYRKDLIGTARVLGQKATFPERLLWSRLRGHQLGLAFRRQRPVGSYVVDFYCPALHLAVEVDGRSHDGAYESDATRQAALEREGLHVLRFTNDEVLADLDGVVDRLRQWLSMHRADAASPPPDFPSS